MSKKQRLRSASSAKGERQIDENVWREALKAVSINDQHWWCIVTMIFESTADHAQYVSIFNDGAAEGKRKAIYPLSWHQVVTSVRTLSKQQPDKCPVMQLVCHYATKVLKDNNGVLPTKLTAYLIKYLIYRAKVEVVARIKAQFELKSQIDEEYRIMQTVLHPDSSRLPSKKTENTGMGDLPKGKANTRLRMHGEAWRDTVFIDDSPLEGPNLYVVLTGFYDPDLPAELVSVEVPLTCILKIKRQSEQLEHRESNDISNHEDFTRQQWLRLLGDDMTNPSDVYTFWMSIEKDLTNATRSKIYNDVAFLTLCPPKLPDIINDDMFEELKKDMYDRVSYLVYDLYDLLQDYSSYLKSLKIDDRINESRKEWSNREIYDTVLDTVPAECMSVPIILQALLVQVEANSVDLTYNHDTEEPGKNGVSNTQIFKAAKLPDTITQEHTEIDKHMLKVEESLPANIQILAKLKTLNLRYELENGSTLEECDTKTQSSDIQLILHGDTFIAYTHHIDIDSEIIQIIDPNAATFIEAILPILWEPRVFELWRCHPQPSDDKMKQYICHLNKVLEQFDRKADINYEGLLHYLHLLLFDRIIHSPSVAAMSTGKSNDEKRTEGNRNLFSNLYPLRIKDNGAMSEPIMLPRLKSESDRCLNSDTAVDYSKLMSAYSELSPLFDLVDPRQIFSREYIENKISKNRLEKCSSLDEYEDVELLPKKVFFQTVYECVQAFDHFKAAYFEPTDSILLYFYNKRAADGVYEETIRSDIRTVVGLREFCKYITIEEEDWINRERERRKLIEARLNAGFARRTTEEDGKPTIFGDECFILQGSLKAKDLMKNEQLIKEKNLSERIKVEKKREKITKGKEATKQIEKREKNSARMGSKKGEKTIVEKTSQKERNAVTHGVDTSFLPRRKILSFECAKTGEPNEFVAYDLGSSRIQIIHVTKKFLTADDMLVRIDVDEWLYDRKDLRIIVSIHDCTLNLFYNVAKAVSEDVFHLTSKEGIILAFSGHHNNQNNTRDSTNSYWQNLHFDFRASWPSGLIIEPILGDTDDNPFYIRQWYMSKGPECTGILHEDSRKFLRNGIVLKYMDDDTVVILRSNGDIITYTHHRKKTSKEDIQLPNRKRKKKLNIIDKPRISGTIINGDHTAGTSEQERESSMFEESVTGEGSQYTVLCHDGRHYEVFNNLIVREYNRLLVRTASDYETGEMFTRRADGTDTLLKSNGELAIIFPDGTRITTGYVIEEQPIVCDWTKDEFQYYFESNCMYKRTEWDRTTSSSKDKSGEEDSPNSQNGDDEEMMRILSEEAFVSVLLKCRMEHENYATVAYDQSTVKCILSMPGNLQVSISPTGCYEVSMTAEVNVKIHDEGVTFSNDACTICGGKSTSTYMFPTPSVVISRAIFTTVDVFGNVLEVRNDGTTRYRAESRRCKRENFKSDGVENGIDGDTSGHEVARDERDADASRDKRCKNHGVYRRKSDPPQRRRHRIFAMNRDFTACEYHHRSVREQQEMTAIFGNETSLMLCPIPRRPELHRLITFLPVEPESRSKAFLQLYRTTKFQPTNNDRTHFLRTTYAIPYDWLFPYGWNGNGVWHNTSDDPLTARTIKYHAPNLLRVRVLHGFKEFDRNAIVDVQAAVGRYWQSIIERGNECDIYRTEECGIENKTENDGTNTDDCSRDLALGIKSHIDVVTYVSGLNRTRKLIQSTFRTTHRSPKFIEFIGRQDFRRTELEWYKQCARERIMVSYFESISGTCFLWVNNCVEEAMRILYTQIH